MDAMREELIGVLSKYIDVDSQKIEMDVKREDEMTALVNTLFGVVTKLAGLRNALSDSHGSNNTDPVASKYIAELALNTSCTLSTIIIRRYKQIN